MKDKHYKEAKRHDSEKKRRKSDAIENAAWKIMGNYMHQ